VTRPQGAVSLNDSSCAPAHNTPLPLERSPPGSFKRLLGARSSERDDDRAEAVRPERGLAAGHEVPPIDDGFTGAWRIPSDLGVGYRSRYACLDGRAARRVRARRPVRVSGCLPLDGEGVDRCWALIRELEERRGGAHSEPASDRTSGVPTGETQDEDTRDWALHLGHTMGVYPPMARGGHNSCGRGRLTDRASAAARKLNDHEHNVSFNSRRRQLQAHVRRRRHVV